MEITYKQYDHIAIIKFNGKPAYIAEYKGSPFNRHWTMEFNSPYCLTIAGGFSSYSGNTLDELINHMKKDKLHFGDNIDLTPEYDPTRINQTN